MARERARVAQKSGESGNTVRSARSGPNSLRLTHVDNRAAAIAQRRIARAMDRSPQAFAYRNWISLLGSHGSEPIQAKFDEPSVLEALIDPKVSARFLGGTKGAYQVETQSPDTDLNPLVVKPKGGSSAVLASQIAIELGIATPNSLMVEAQPRVVKNLERAGVRDLGQETRFEVQQWAEWGRMPNSKKDKPVEDLAVGRISVLDALTANPDRVENQNTDNMRDGAAIDNGIGLPTNNSIMPAVLKALEESRGELIPFVNKNIHEYVAGYKTAGYSANNRIRGLRVQLEMIQAGIDIQKKMATLRQLIENYDKGQKSSTENLILELQRLSALDKPDDASTVEFVVTRNTKPGESRKDVIARCLESARTDLSRRSFAGPVVIRLAEIEKMDFVQAKTAVEEAIAAAQGVHDEKHQKWRADKKKAEKMADDAWEDTFCLLQCFRNYRKFIDGWMANWEKYNPEPIFKS